MREWVYHWARYNEWDNDYATEQEYAWVNECENEWEIIMNMWLSMSLNKRFRMSMWLSDRYKI